MIDWQNVKVDDLRLELDSGNIRELGDTIIFPVLVKDQEGALLFTKPVSVRADFFAGFRVLPDWKKTLWIIFTNRVQEDILARRKKSPVSIEDKVELLSSPEPGNPNSQP